MPRYYAVGQAIETVESASFIEGVYFSGINSIGLGARRPRVITESIIKDEAFPTGKISLIFTKYEDAKKYAEALGGEVHNPGATWPFQSGAPILTFETDKLDMFLPTEERITNAIKSEDQREYVWNQQRYYMWEFDDKKIIEKFLAEPLKLSVISHELKLNEINFIKAEFPVVFYVGYQQAPQPVDFTAPAALEAPSRCQLM